MVHRLMYMCAGVLTVTGTWGIATSDKGGLILFEGLLLFVCGYINERTHWKQP